MGPFVAGAALGLVLGCCIGMAWATALWKRRLTAALVRRMELRTKNGRPRTDPLNSLLDDPTCSGMMRESSEEFWGPEGRYLGR